MMIDGETSLVTMLDGDAGLTIGIEGEYGIFQKVEVGGDYYDGATEVTPTESTQVLYTADKTMLSNVTVLPIPTNYGRVTWDGSKLTIE
jgi:hypothetical protein